MTLTDVAAWVGAAAGIAALLWQAVTRRRSTHNVRVTRAQSWLTSPNGELSPDLVSVTAHNIGAGPVTVTSWGIRISPKSNIVVPYALSSSTPLPFRLESGADGVWFVEADALLKNAAEKGLTSKQMKSWRAWVRLATGETIFAKRGVPIGFAED